MSASHASILIKHVTIVDPESTHHQLTQDILIEDGIVSQIGKNLNEKPEVRVVKAEDAYLCPGWCDIGSHCGEPGDEVHETLDTLCRAANVGGYTHIGLFSNDTRPFDNRHIISDTKARAVHGVEVIPIGAVTKSLEGLELAEMLDLATVSPAVFTDGFHRKYDNSMLTKALEYSLQCKGTVLTIPGAKRKMKKGLVNESKVSAQMGIPGIPGFEEVVTLSAELSLVSYTGSPVFVHLLSHRDALEQIKFRKDQGLTVSASVSAMHLLNTEDDVLNFDENFKILPPLRSDADRSALRSGLRAGIIDTVVSNHRPVSSEQKEKEFGESPFGAIGLETTFLALVSALEDITPLEVHTWLSKNPRKLLGIISQPIEEGVKADFTIFSLSGETVYEANNSMSLSSNSPYQHQRFKGRVIGTVSKNHLYLTS